MNDFLWFLIASGVLVLGVLVAFTAWLGWQQQERGRQERLRVQQTVLQADRRIHKITSDAFQSMLDAARKERQR